MADTLSHIITIYVEGKLICNDISLNVMREYMPCLFKDIPNCVENLNISSKLNDTSYVVSWNRYNGLLPVMYNISIWSTSSEVVVSESTEHPLFHLDSDVYHLSNTKYFVLVTTCNSFGCSQDCDNTTIQPGGVLLDQCCDVCVLMVQDQM